MGAPKVNADGLKLENKIRQPKKFCDHISNNLQGTNDNTCGRFVAQFLLH